MTRSNSSAIRVYVAGPYTKGDVAVNVKNAIEFGSRLMDFGFAPYIPHFTHFQHIMLPRPYQDWIEQDNAFLPFCQALFRLPGESSGADDEVGYATSLNIPVFTILSELQRWARGVRKESI